MEASWRWGLGGLGAATAVGLVAGVLMFEMGRFPPPALAALLGLALLMGPMVGAQAYRRGIPGFLALGASCGGAVPLGFVLGLCAMSPPDLGQADHGALFTLFVVVPGVVGLMSAAGTAYLVRGVRRYRQVHGLARAPR